MEKIPLGRHFKLGRTSRVHTTPGYCYQEPPGSPFLWSPRRTNGILPAVLQQQLVLQNCAKRKRRKLLASSAASRGPGPPVAPAPSPLDSPRSPRPESRDARRPRPGFPRPGGSRRPRGRRRPGRGRGGLGPQAPGAAARPLPAPLLSRLPHLNSSRPPSSLARSSPFPGADCSRYSSPRLGPWARPRQARGALGAVSRARGGG